MIGIYNTRDHPNTTHIFQFINNTLEAFLLCFFFAIFVVSVLHFIITYNKKITIIITIKKFVCFLFIIHKLKSTNEAHPHTCIHIIIMIIATKYETIFNEFNFFKINFCYFNTLFHIFYA